MTPEVNCPQCGEVNPASARFCMACGASLARNCPSCGVEAPAGTRFCGACGAGLDGAAPASAAPKEPSAIEERRTVTVAFADVSGYTAVAERLDHETVKALIERCLTRLAAEVEIFGGRVDKYIGDNVMAVFGAPTAHEDDAERAVRAALGMQAAMSELNRAIAPEFGFELGLRIGVNTGEVLAGRIGEAYTVVGDTVNVASRLQAAAPVGGILVGERTQRQSATSIVYRKLEPVSLKGKAKPVPVWEALAVKEPAASGEAPAAGTPLVGRSEQLGQLEALIERAVRDAGPQLLTVIGEAGVGKSRLLREFEALLQRREPPVRTCRGRCLAFGSSVVYWPLSEMLRAECGILDVDSSEQARAKLTERLGPLLSAHEDPELVEHRLASLARLLGAELPDDHLAAQEEDQQSARESFFGAVRAVFEALAGEGAVVLAWEDVHWADEGTLDLIEYLAQWLRAPVLQVCLARDELLARRPNWSTLRRTVTTTFLEPLDQRDTRALVAALLGESVTAIELPETLAERSGGNPLFAEEMVQRIAAEGGATAAELPDTIQGLLAARLDSLEPFERQLVAHAAVLGRTFWEAALEPLAAAAGENLTTTLAGLREKDIIIPGEGGSAGQPELAFKHVLIRDVAYEILPKAARARKHAEVGAFIERRVGEGGEGIVALAAEHYARAAALGGEVRMPVEELDGLRTRALECGEAAGDTAAALYSNLEALAHYDTAATFAEPGGTSA
ncbi:MAG: hypothetical protein QOI03_75, partial [Solirubrobacteraceae bacterium]|nr:hypothetical protein [Solirubrobacteraceae bacterium]